MNKTERNEKAKIYITDRLDKAQTSTELQFERISNYQALSDILTDLINVKSMGFRGVVATALAGLYINPMFDPLNDFYSCNPRSIFENGIFYAFENRIPCGKSDPLNVAKNVSVLDEVWASGKRPEKAAFAVVNYLKAVMTAPNIYEKELIIDLFFYRLHLYAEKTKSIVIANPNSRELSNQIIGHKLAEFIYLYPESGATPQVVTALLLKKVFERYNYTVQGGDESVFGTNTTSKKPADIWIEIDGVPAILYEITVKKVDKKRLDDCIQSLSNMNMLNKPIHFICRIPEDISTLDSYKDGTYSYKGIKFGFVDLKSFILTLASLATLEQLDAVIAELSCFMKKIERQERTKIGWNSIFCH